MFLSYSVYLSSSPWVLQLITQNTVATEIFRGTVKATRSSGTILPLVFCGCETWSHVGQHRLREFENRVMGKIFGPKRDEVTGQWTGLHNEWPYGPYFLPNVTWVIKPRIMRWAGHVACMGRREVYTGFWYGNLRERNHLAGYY